MSEVTACPQCGNELEFGTTECPHCGVHLEYQVEEQAEQQAEVAAPANRFQAIVQTVLASIQTHRMWWAGGAGGALLVAIAAIVAFGGFFGPSGKVVCTAALTQAREFGVISPTATLASTSAKSTDVKNRKQCAAQVGNDSYVLLADLKSEDAEQKKCKDFEKQAGCIKLYSVVRSDGMTPYQVREIPPDQTDEAILAGESKPGAPPSVAGGDPGASDPGSLDSETAVDNSAGAPPPAGEQPQQ